MEEFEVPVMRYCQTGFSWDDLCLKKYRPSSLKVLARNFEEAEAKLTERPGYIDNYNSLNSIDQKYFFDQNLDEFIFDLIL